MEKHQAAGCHPGVSISLSSLSGMRGQKDDVTRQGFTSPELPLPRLEPEVSFKEDFFFSFFRISFLRLDLSSVSPNPCCA